MGGWRRMITYLESSLGESSRRMVYRADWSVRGAVSERSLRLIVVRGADIGLERAGGLEEMRTGVDELLQHHLQYNVAINSLGIYVGRRSKLLRLLRGANPFPQVSPKRSCNSPCIIED
ncbi:hypothetical protein Tco_0857296 [Tanacetum coccineum]|uniref:Uncharacterized protein n=1 Tax=Tanacetum coccineum TaxID=301880 RepID=A0ABQ5BBI2_9ASTR